MSKYKYVITYNPDIKPELIARLYGVNIKECKCYSYDETVYLDMFDRDKRSGYLKGLIYLPLRYNIEDYNLSECKAIV